MKRTKAWVEYFLCLALSVMYLIFLDGRAGMFILSALIAAPFISAVMAYYAKEKISFSLNTTKTILKKGENAEVNIVFSTTSLLPTPFILVKLYSDEHLETDNGEYKLTLRPKNEKTISKNFSGAISGEGKIGLSSVIVTDYLGLISFNLYQEKGLGEYSETIGIIPNIPDTTLKNDLIKSVSAAVASEESEETTDATAVFGGNPGYEHKEYVPGDPIKRINWKLSTKQDKLMVRLDEGTAEAKQYAVLDFARNEISDITEMLCDEERLAEGLLGFAATLSKLGKELILFVLVKRKWQQISIKTIDDVYSLQFSFAHMKFLDTSEAARMPQVLMNGEIKASALTVFTNLPDGQLSSFTDTLEHKGTICYTAISKPTASNTGNLWIIRDDYSFGKYI